MLNPIIFKFPLHFPLNARLAEVIASEVLSQKFKYKILAKNFRYIGTELDLICSLDTNLIIIEIKYRNKMPTTLEDFQSIINYKKRMALKRGALYFISKNSTKFSTIRFDLAVISTNKSDGIIKYYKNFLEFEEEDIV